MQKRSESKFLYIAGSLVFFASYILCVAACYVDAARESEGTQLQEKAEIVVVLKSAEITGDEEETEMKFSEEKKKPCSLYAGRKMLHQPCKAAAAAARAWRNLLIYDLADYKDPTANIEPPSIGHRP